MKTVMYTFFLVHANNKNYNNPRNICRCGPDNCPPIPSPARRRPLPRGRLRWIRRPPAARRMVTPAPRRPPACRNPRPRRNDFVRRRFRVGRRRRDPRRRFRDLNLFTSFRVAKVAAEDRAVRPRVDSMGRAKASNPLPRALRFRGIRNLDRGGKRPRLRNVDIAKSCERQEREKNTPQQNTQQNKN